jgi:tRNA(His) 5'-end guanylyltransferase
VEEKDYDARAVMRRPTHAEELGTFEVFTGRDLVPGRPLIARLIGRRFDALLDGVGYAKPFDAGFGKNMVKTLSHLLTSLGCSFGFAEQAELSLFAISGGGDARRLLSRISGEGSAKLSLLLGNVSTFEARLYELPDVPLAVDYFRWRQHEAHLRALDRYCLHVLGQQGTEPQGAERIISGLGPEDKVELLRQNGLDFGGVPSWQRRGASVALRAGNADGHDARARLVVDLNLPNEEEFGAYLRPILGVPEPS